MITISSAVATLFAVGGAVKAISLGSTSRDERTVYDYVIPVAFLSIAIAGWMACFYREYYL